jgi:hypothetical protein
MTKVAVGMIGTALLLACGGGSGATGHVCEGASTTPPELGVDLASGFTGDWVGTLSTVIDGEPETPRPAELVISRQGVNLLALAGICPGADPGLVQSATAFDTACFVCPSTAAGNCASWIVTYTDGTSTLDGDSLEVVLNATAVGCGRTLAITQTLSAATRFAGVGGPAASVQADLDLGFTASLAAAVQRGR